MRSRVALTGILCLVPGILFSQKMTVKDNDNHVLMEVNDEGTVGSMTLEDSTVAPTVTTNKLYNVGGALFWNGSALGMSGSAGGWTDGGANVYTTTSTDKVGIGASTPEFKLTLDDDGGIIARGTFGSGDDLSTSGEGTRLIWYPKKAAFRAGYINEKQWNDPNIGNYSMATGMNSKASGASSIAMGSATLASGESSAALGWNTSATAIYSTVMGAGSSSGGFASTAMGYYNTASGDYSTAMGHYVAAESYLSTVVGKFNVGGGTADAWIAADPLFEIGIGADGSSKANAVTVLKNGKVGIGTAAPEFMLTLENDGGLIAKGTFGSGADLNTTGVGTRMVWYPMKSAFRAGSVVGSEWDDANIGDYSTAIGYATIASGEQSMATGSGSSAIGQISTAMGNGSTASGFASTATGNATTAAGHHSTAMGDHVLAESYASTAIGCYNIGGGTATSWVSTDPLFEVGIGSGSLSRENALTVLKNGNVGIGTISPMADLTVNGPIIFKIEATTGTGEDDTDEGYVSGRSLTFTKRYNSTSIRVLYCDNFKVAGRGWVGSSWWIKFNEADPPGGSICQAIVQLHLSEPEYLYPTDCEQATIVGYAAGLSAGVYNIQIRVSPVIPGTDAVTGWGGGLFTLEAQEVFR